MALIGPSPMDVVFSFDTTGSMSQALEQVKAYVNDIVQKLQADIPGVKIGIIAHGDYCDAEHFYDIRSLDLSDNVVDVVTFVNETDGTGGGDIPECYEMALLRANGMGWREGSRRVLVMIGDAYPHEADYELNVQNIDWKKELEDLAMKNVRIYGVQVQNDEKSTPFFQQLTYRTDGQHLQLENMARVCEVIMGICYREQGPAMFKNYEEEIRNKEAENFGPDLECMFGTLRSELSRTSDMTTILDRDDDEVDEDVDMRDGTRKRKRCLSDNTKTKRKHVRFEESDSNDDDDDDDDFPPAKRMKLSDPNEIRPVSKSSSCQSATQKKKTKHVVSTSKRCCKARNTTTDKRYRRHYRERVPAKRFKYDSLPWSPWHLAVCPKENMKKRNTTGEWKTVLRGDSESLWRRDLLQLIPLNLQSHKLQFEIALAPHKVHRRKVVSFHVTRPSLLGRINGVFSKPWYLGVFHSIRHRLDAAVLNKCRVFIRWTHGTPKERLDKEYDYAWRGQLSMQRFKL